MAIMTPENFLKNLEVALESVILFDEKITIATDEGNAILINEKAYENIITIIKSF